MSTHKEKDLKKAAWFAAVAPAVMALLIGTSLNSPATAGDWGDSSYGDSYGDRDHDKDRDKDKDKDRDKDKDKGERPGWGFGDKNHEHSGPPGLSDKDSHY